MTVVVERGGVKEAAKNVAIRTFKISKMSTTGENAGQRTLHHEVIAQQRDYVRSRVAYVLFRTCRLCIKGKQ